MAQPTWFTWIQVSACCSLVADIQYHSVDTCNQLCCVAGNDDVVTLKSDDQPNDLTLMFEDPKQDRVAGLITFKLAVSVP